MCGPLILSSKSTKVLKYKRTPNIKIIIPGSKVHWHLCVTDNPEQKSFKSSHKGAEQCFSSWVKQARPHDYSGSDSLRSQSILGEFDYALQSSY